MPVHNILLPLTARDHGIPGYAAYRHICGLSRIHNWDDMEIFPEDLNILKRIYSSVHDVDLFVGGLVRKLSIGSQ